MTAALAERFEAARPHLQRVAYRTLGSAAEADDALQESWLRVSRADASGVDNVEGWLVTIVARVCFDVLRKRKSRREEFTPDDPRHGMPSSEAGVQPEDEAVLADSLDLAMRVLLDALSPAERVAFVLHDVFDVPFDRIAPIVDKTTEATRQLASRARRRVRGPRTEPDPRHEASQRLVLAFLEASRSGNFRALLGLLDPNATLRADAAVMAMGGAQYWQSERLDEGVRGARVVAETFAGRARAAQPAYLAGEPAAVWVHERQPRVVFRFTTNGGRITGIEMIADPHILNGVVIEYERTEA